MTLHREGTSTILIVLFSLAIINSVVFNFTPFFIGYSFCAISIVFFLFIVSFFRKPDRTVLVDNGKILAPADGKVVVIEKTVESEYFKDERIQVSIFMSPLNVHINWYPITGLIKYFKYHPGDKMVAWHPKASQLNERSTVVLENAVGKQLLQRQIAGALARRIVCYSNQNQSVSQGQEMGFIKFGSRVDIFLPLDAKILVDIDQKVTGNRTVVASFE